MDDPIKHINTTSFANYISYCQIRPRLFHTIAVLLIIATFLLWEIFHGNLNEAISANEIASFRFPRKISLKRKLGLSQKPTIKTTAKFEN